MLTTNYPSALTTSFSSLLSFTGTAGTNPGAHPSFSSVLTAGSDGNFYGVTNQGGAAYYGTVFKLTGAGVQTTLTEFTGSEGVYPYGLLAEGAGGFFYGINNQGGANGAGTIYKVSPAGVQTTLVDFNGGNGSNPVGGLIKGTDGNFYGTTQTGGTSNNGTVFKVTPAGVLTTLVSFTGNAGATPGSNPYSGLMQAADGNFYGTTTQGGANGVGVVYKVTPAGVATTLVEFSGADGAYPYGVLVQATDGTFYGTVGGGGTFGAGTAFKMTDAGVLTTLVNFNVNNGQNPLGALIPALDGSFYGTTQKGGTYGGGTLFNMTTAGVLTTLHQFSFNDGAEPMGSLVAGGAGHYFGTTRYGGDGGFGTVFDLSLSTKVAAREGVVATQSGTFSDADGNETVTLTASSGTVTQDNVAGTWSWSATGADGPATSQVTITATDATSATAVTSFAFEVANVAPTVAIVGPTVGDLNTPIAFTFTATDVAADMAVGFEWALNYGDGTDTVYTAGTSPLAAPHAYEYPGTYTVTATAVDKDYAGAIAEAHEITISDMTPPQTTIVSGPPSVTISTSATFDFSANEASTFTYTLDGGAPTTGDGPVTFSGLANGPHTFSVFATDAEGNADPTPATQTWAVQLDPVSTELGAKGGAVPGAGVSGSGIPAGAVWVSFGFPCINDANQCAVLASYKAGTVTTSAILGFQLGDMAATMRVVAKKGDPVPAYSNVVLGALKDPLLGPDGGIVWQATLANALKTTGAVLPVNNTAIFCDADGTGPLAAVVVVRKGDGAAGGGTFNTFSSIALGARSISFAATVLGATPTTDGGLWFYDIGSATIAAGPREGSTQYGPAIKTINTLVALPGSPGQGHGVASLVDNDFTTARLTLTDNTQLIVPFTQEALSFPRYTYSKGGNAPGYGGEFLSLGIPTQNSVSAAMAFLGTVKPKTGTATTLNNVAIFAEDDVDYIAAPVVAKGSIADGGDGGVFATFKDPVSASGRQVAFIGTLKVDTTKSIGATNNDGIWATNALGEVKLVAREGGLLPNASESNWKAFTSLALPEGRGPIFLATIRGNLITTANDTSLWATDSNGALRLVLQEGDAIGTSTVKTFAVISSVVGSPAQTHSFNNVGSIIVKATDAVGAQHLIYISVP